MAGTRQRAQDWLEPDKLILLQGWARDGLTNVQIAENMGISDNTLYQWVKRYPQISQSIKKGKEVVDFAVENALLKEALAGNTTAQIFWLKNRRSDKWRDRQEKVIDGGENPLKIDSISETATKIAAILSEEIGVDDE